MNASTRFGLSVSLVALLVTSPALAFDDPLSSSAIRDAYILGNRKDFKTAEFFASYKHSLPTPESGPYVATITVETPYGQIVELGEAAMNIDVQGAEERLAGKKFPFIVRVGVDVTDDYPGPSPSNPHGPSVPPDFERDFKIQLLQKDKKISPKSTEVHLLYSDAVSNIYQISGAVIELRYYTADLDSYGDATISVHTLDGQNMETSFDLGQLK
jgi:hypothetical protein